jgi:hypothetical protein
MSETQLAHRPSVSDMRASSRSTRGINGGTYKLSAAQQPKRRQIDARIAGEAPRKHGMTEAEGSSLARR